VAQLAKNQTRHRKFVLRCQRPSTAHRSLYSMSRTQWIRKYYKLTVAGKSTGDVFARDESQHPHNHEHRDSHRRGEREIRFAVPELKHHDRHGFVARRGQQQWNGEATDGVSEYPN